VDNTKIIVAGFCSQCIPVVPVEHTRQYIVCDCETIVACSVLFKFTSANKQWMNVVLVVDVVNETNKHIQQFI
jgi:hypothetical protein